jgi:hypothetical protein
MLLLLLLLLLLGETKNPARREDGGAPLCAWG